MSNPKVMKMMVAIAICSAASGFIAPAHVGKSVAIPSAPKTPMTPRAPSSRGKAVVPLSGLELPNILDIFNRE